MNKDKVVGRLVKEKSRKFAKVVFFFLKADVSDMTKVKINGKAVKERKGKEMEVPCPITFLGNKQTNRSFINDDI